ncbi:hypothetical protein [Rhizohabitans arisaemae]|uniref:hypothetical protein n=1 Tax=Rhizohabitans arisaemae TaxID=2720610 RepID=UPI0024B26FE3|nr:hypothetical protein [Rhizohabitans arisaemae]
MSPIARFSATSSAILGLLFIILETARRGIDAWGTTSVTILEDYIAGILLVTAAVALIRSARISWPLMLAASAYATGMMTSSLWGQVEAQLRGETWETQQSIVIAVKAFLWLLPLILSVFSLRELRRGFHGEPHSGS